MSFSNTNNRAPKVLDLRKQMPKAPIENTDSEALKFLLKGQGVFLFTLKKASQNQKETLLQNGQNIAIYLFNEDHTDGLKFEIGYNYVCLSRIKGGKIIAEERSGGLLPNTNANYWISLDNNNFLFRYGVGEARLETKTFGYEFTYANEEEKDKTAADFESKHALRTFLESISTIKPEPQDLLVPLKLLRDPIVMAVPLCVKDTDALTMVDIANNGFLPRANLSPIGQKLFDNVSGVNFVLNTEDFPQFSQAIEYSIATEGCCCHEKLKEKSTEFGKPNPYQTYLRITLGQNSGESPGVPYVMEIWPPGHYSPIHNHAGANAIIRVLHGAISVKLFRFLDPEQGFAVKTFSEGDVTWISPDLNQIHQLKNLDGNIETCITIQCYMYDSEDKTHYDFFDYLDDENEIGHFDPDSDFDFLTLKNKVRKEWEDHLKAKEQAFLNEK